MEIAKKSAFGGAGENIISMWFNWHFYQMPGFLFGVWKNYMAFFSDFFSITLLSKTLFFPWHKYTWGYPGYFSIVEYLNTFISNFFSRIIGAVCRLSLIVFGIVVQIFVLVFGFIAMLLWLLLPCILIALLFYGI